MRERVEERPDLVVFVGIDSGDEIADGIDDQEFYIAGAVDGFADLVDVAEGEVDVGGAAFGVDALAFEEGDALEVGAVGFVAEAEFGGQVFASHDDDVALRGGGTVGQRCSAADGAGDGAGEEAFAFAAEADEGGDCAEGDSSWPEPVVFLDDDFIEFGEDGAVRGRHGVSPQVQGWPHGVCGVFRYCCGFVAPFFVFNSDFLTQRRGGLGGRAGGVFLTETLRHGGEA